MLAFSAFSPSLFIFLHFGPIFPSPSVYFLPNLIPFLTLTYFFLSPHPICRLPLLFTLFPSTLLLFLFTSIFPFHPSFSPTVISNLHI